MPSVDAIILYVWRQELLCLHLVKPTKCRLSNVLHVPDLGYLLLSLNTLDKSRLIISFCSGRCEIKKSDSLLATGSMVGNLYRLDSVSNINTHALVSRNLDLRHRRLAHINPTVVSDMTQKIAKGMGEIMRTDNYHCSHCLAGKGHRSPIPQKPSSRTSHLLELVHSDFSGPLEVPSLGGSHYFVTFIDDLSKWAFVYTMKQKSETFVCFKKFHKLAQRHTGLKIQKVNVINRTNLPPAQLKTLRTDNGGEYLSTEFKDYLLEHGIRHELTVAYTPQQNWVAERMNEQSLILFVQCINHPALPKTFGPKPSQLQCTSEIEYRRTLYQTVRHRIIVGWESLLTYPTSAYLVANVGTYSQKCTPAS